MLFSSAQRPVAFRNASRLARTDTLIAHELGYNDLVNYAADARDIEAMRSLGIEPIANYRVKATSGATTLDAANSLRQRGLWDYVRLCVLGDEIDLHLTASDDEQNLRFRQYLRDRGFKPGDFVRPEDQTAAAHEKPEHRWSYVRLQGPLPPDRPKLLFEAATFRYKLWVEELADATREIRMLYPPGTLSGACLSPHLSFWPDVRKWIDPVKLGAMTMPWSEDWWWQVPEPGPQALGYMLDALRLAASYHDSPVRFECIADPGETPEQFIRVNYLAVAHGVKELSHFTIYNQAWGTSDYVDFSLSERMFLAIRRVIGDLAQVDEQLFAARVRPADAAILLSKANDVWDTEDMLSSPDQKRADKLYWAAYNVDNNERKGIWMALRHAQYPVDLITDDDVIEGRLGRYKVLYLAGPEIQAAAASAISAWVQQGGVLFASAGVGLLGEYRQRLDAMYSLYGIIGAHLVRAQRHVEPRKLLSLVPAGTMRLQSRGWPKLEMPAIAYRQAFDVGLPAKAAGGGSSMPPPEVIGRFEDGSPAALARTVGKGHVIVVGTMPGLAYLRPAMGDKGALPVHYSREVRELLTVPLHLAGCSRHVQTSQPLVEATLMESGGSRALVPLVNFSPERVQKLRVSLPGIPNVGSCRSIRHGELAVHGSGRNCYVELPIDEADLLVVAARAVSGGKG
jgi:hypothetical protein